MSVIRTVPYHYYIYGDDSIYEFWSHVFGTNSWVGEHWTTRSLPFYGQNNAAYVDMSLNVPLVDSRDNDHLTLTDPVGQGGRYVLNIKGVEHIDAPASDEVHLEIVGKHGFTTDGSLASLRMNVGHHTMVYTGATRDQTLFMGSGWDKVQLVDHPDVNDTQYWSVIRRIDGEVDAYSLYSGYRVRMQGGSVTWGNTNGRNNYGEVDEIQLASRIREGGDVFLSGVNLSSTEDRGSFDNIDLSTTGAYDFTDRLNSASFKSINYATTNVHKGTAVVETFVGDTVVGTQSSIKDHITTNGVHYLIVEQQTAALDGHLRLYVRDNMSGLYNRFNEVFLGASGSDVNANNYTTTSSNAYANDATGSGTNKVLSTVMYGFDGNDALSAGNDVDYLFGGTSTYSTIVTANNLGNQLTGGDSSDYFGVGNISAGADGDAIMSTDFTARLSGSAPLSTSDTGKLARLDVVGSGGTSIINYASDTADLATRVATDRITDWAAGTDYLRVLANGTAIIEGLGTTNGAGGAYIADIIGSDPELIDLSGARVNNEGKIVARGLGGVDTLVGSSGDDWLYGNDATNYYSLSSGGNDRVFVDRFDGSRSKHYATGFTRSDGVAADRDVVMLNMRIIDAFYPGGAGRTALKLDIDATYTSGQAKSSGVNYLYNSFYSGSYSATNATHEQADGGGFWQGGGGADGTTSYIGLGMAIAGRGMFAIPFVGPIIGAAMIAASIPIEGLGFDPSPTREHRNATYSGTVNAYLNVLTDSYGGNGVSLNTTGGVNETSVRFLDFFQGSNTGDGYLPVVEFTAHSGQSIYGYFALHSDDETFVFLVASSDNMVENAEAIFVAEIDGSLTAADFGIYDGERDVYNYSTIPAVVIRTPTVTKVADSATPTADEAQVDSVLSDVRNPIVISGTVSGALEARSYFRVYDGPNKIYDGESAVSDQQVTLSLSGTNFTFTDSRALGTTVQNTTNTGLNDTFVLSDAYVRYTVELIDGETGLPTRVSVKDIRVSGGNATIDGGNGSDILLVTETSPFLSSVGDVRLVGMERIVLAGAVTIVNGNQVPTPISINLSNQSEGFDIVSGGADDSIVASSGNDVIYGVGGADAILAENGADTVVYSTGYETSTTLVNDIETNTTTNNIVLTAAESLAADLTVDGGDGVDSLQFDTDRYEGSTRMYSAPVVLTDADFLKVIRFENLVMNGTGTHTVTLGTNANTAFATGITVTTVATATSLNFDASNASWARTANVTGTNAADTITGGSANDTLSGGSGNDTIEGKAGFDSLSGGNDDDSFVYDSAAPDATGLGETIAGGDGTDRIVVAGGTTSVNFSDDSISNIETLELTQTVVGAADGNAQSLRMTHAQIDALSTINAAVGDNITLHDAMTSDMLGAADANKTVVNGTLELKLTEQTGNIAQALTLLDGAMDDVSDLLKVDASGLIGGDILTFIGSAETTARVSVTGGDGADSIVGSNSSLTDIIFGGSGNDTITGGAGADNLSGGDGEDVFIVLAGTEHGGSETITGGFQSDTVRFASATTNDTLTLSANVTDTDNVLNVVISTAAGATSGTTALNVTAVALTGSLAVNLTGNDGANQLTGTANADTISAGAGADTITGGAGSDKFVFESTAAANGADIITDFMSGTDQINVSAFETAMGVVTVTDDLTPANGTVYVLTSQVAGSADSSADVSKVLNAAATWSNTTATSWVVVSDDNSSTIYEWVNVAGGNDEVEVGELTLVATINGILASTDFIV